MGRGASTPENVTVERAGRPERASVFPSPQLDDEHPIADLWGLVGNLGPVAEEQRCLRDYLLADPLDLAVDPGTTPTLVHSQMKPYVGPGGERVMAHPISRRMRVSGPDGVALGTVGDFLVQTDDGRVRIERRADFKSGFERIEMTPFPQAVVPLAGEVRQALLEGRLDDAFADLRDAGGLERRSLELRALGETLLQESWNQAGAGGHNLELAEEVTDWLGISAGFTTSVPGTQAAVAAA